MSRIASINNDADNALLISFSPSPPPVQMTSKAVTTGVGCAASSPSPSSIPKKKPVGAWFETLPPPSSDLLLLMPQQDGFGRGPVAVDSSMNRHSGRSSSSTGYTAPVNAARTRRADSPQRPPTHPQKHSTTPPPPPPADAFAASLAAQAEALVRAARSEYADAWAAWERERAVAETNAARRYADAAAGMTRRVRDLEEVAAVCKVTVAAREAVIDGAVGCVFDKLHSRSVLARIFACWRIQYADSQNLRLMDRVAAAQSRRSSLRRAIFGWQRVCGVTWRRTVERSLRIEAERAMASLAGEYESRIAELQKTLEATRLRLSDTQSTLLRAQTDMKNALMRGVCALNMEAMSVFRTDGSSTNASAIDGSYISTKPMLQPSNNGALKAWTGVETAMSSPSRENHPSTPFKISPNVTSALANATMSKNVRVPANSQSEEDFGAAKKLSLPVQPLFLGSKFSDIQELAQPIGGRKDTRNYVVQEATKKKYAHGMRARGMMKGEHVGVQVWFRMNSFEEVKAAIAADAFLTSAKLEDNLIRLTLTTYGDDVRRSMKVLTNFAHWHAENLNDPAARVSILHVHAFFLTKMYYGLPHLVARDGRFLAFRSLNADRIGGIPKQFSAFMAMFLFYRAQLPAMDLRWVDLSNVENFKVMNLRLTLYKELNDVAASVPVVPTSALIFHNCNPYFVASLRAVQRQFPEFPQILFTKGQELFQYVDPSMLPQEFGGTITPEQMDADIEDQIKRMYALEGLRYSPIDVKAINWRTYRVPGPVYESRPYSSISSQPIDFDAIDAHLRAMGISDDHEMDLDEGDNSKSNKSNTKRIH